MRIGVDLDGVVYSYQSAACHLLNTYRGYNLDWRDWNTWDWIHQVSTKEDQQWLMSEGITKGLFRYGHIQKNAIEGIGGLREMGHDIVFITHRPPAAVQSTLDFLSYARLSPSAVHILSNEEPKKSIECDVYVDDKPQTIADIVVNTPKHGILYAQRWNRGVVAGEGSCERFYRAYGWMDVVKRVAEIV